MKKIFYTLVLLPVVFLLSHSNYARANEEQTSFQTTEDSDSSTKEKFTTASFNEDEILNEIQNEKAEAAV